MKISKKQSIISIISILIILFSVTLGLLDVIIPLNLWTHPVLNVLFALFVGFGCMCFVLAFLSKSPWYFFLGSILVALAIVYLFVQFLPWWIGVVVAVGIIAISGIFSFMVAGNQTEEISLNKSPDYKNYQERKAEKLAKEEEKVEEELPTLKSFKD